jgi:hypothetical protein
MPISLLDITILIPLAPLLLAVITWWHPSERGVLDTVPKHVLGPYLLFAAFAAWHFSFPWWTVLMVALIGVVLSVGATLEKTETPNRGLAAPQFPVD